MDTTIGPCNTPAGVHGRLVRYIGTLQPVSRWRTGTPARSKAFSNVNEQPSRKPTRSSRHQDRRSAGSSTSSPWPPGIVVALLGAQELIAGEQHGHALRQKQRRDQVFGPAAAQACTNAPW